MAATKSGRRGAAIANSQRQKQATAKQMALLEKLNEEKGFESDPSWTRFVAADWRVARDEIDQLLSWKSEYQKYNERVAKREFKRVVK